MGAGMRVLTIVGIAVFCLIQVAYAATGTATYYTSPYIPSACYGYQNDGVMIAAASNAIWNNKTACGTMYRVRCTGPTNQGVQQPCKDQSVVVKIVDYCPSGCAGTFDLSQEAFSMIADPNAGKVNIEYTPFEYAATTGTATYHTPPYVPSSCYGYQNNGVMIAAVNAATWNNGTSCGMMYKVRCIGPQPCKGESVVVKIVDYCQPPKCIGNGTFDLSQEAFSVIADLVAGEIKIEYTQEKKNYTQQTLLLFCN